MMNMSDYVSLRLMGRKESVWLGRILQGDGICRPLLVI